MDSNEVETRKPGRLGESTILGVSWSVAERTLAGGIRLVVMIYLLRILGAAEYGRLAGANILINWIGGIFEGPVSEDIIQRRGESSTLELSGAAVSGLLMAGIAVLVSLVSSRILFEGISHLIRIAAVTLVVFPISSRMLAFERKNLRFGVVSMAMILGTITWSVVAAVGVGLGLGVEALVIGVLAERLVSVLIVLSKSCSSYSFTLGKNAVISSLGFSSFVGYRTGAMFVNNVVSRLDQWFIGYFLGEAQLGLYSLAMQAVEGLRRRGSSIFSRIMLPVLAEAKASADRFRRAYFDLLRVSLIVGGLILILQVALAKELVFYTLNSAWQSAARLVLVLAFYSFFRSIGVVNAAPVVATGQAKVTLIWNLLAGLGGALIFWWAASSQDVMIVAYSVTVFQAVLGLVYFLILVRPTVGKPSNRQARGAGIAFLLPVSIAFGIISLRWLFLGGGGVFLAVFNSVVGVAVLLLGLFLDDRPWFTGKAKTVVGMLRARVGVA